MKLSVIIPCFNERPYIERVLQRVVTALPQVEDDPPTINGRPKGIALDRLPSFY